MGGYKTIRVKTKKEKENKKASTVNCQYVVFQDNYDMLFFKMINLCCGQMISSLFLEYFYDPQ